MTLEQMVREACDGQDCTDSYGIYVLYPEQLERFAALVRAHALDEAAAVCDSYHYAVMGSELGGAVRTLKDRP